MTAMRANDVQSTEPLRHGAYVCLGLPPGAAASAAAAPVPELADRLRLRNEFEPGSSRYPSETIAFLRRAEASPGDVEDQALLGAGAVVHVASARPEPVAEFCDELARLLPSALDRPVLCGVVRPKLYTGLEMHNFAYAHWVLQQPGPVMPNAFLVPLRKTREWWEKGWMERHTYFLPRYDDSGRMLSEGHAMAAEAGIECLLRRTYGHPTEPAPPGSYDFLTYFECADEDVPTFHEVLTALRDVARNPEWRFVHEGPTWRGRRVASWSELFD
jgi:hypothetical protein